MPDTTLSQGLIRAAKKLVPTAAVRPPQAALRRAVSTSYYAVFHSLAKLAADALIGSTKASRPNKAWVEVYRGLGHGTCLDACKRASDIEFPDDLKDFADAFVQLQEARHSADYDPMIRLSKEDARLFISLADRSIASLKCCSTTDRKAFATWVLITSRGVKDARKRVRDGRVRDLRGPVT